MKHILGGLIVAALLAGASASRTEMAGLTLGAASVPRPQGDAVPAAQAGRFVVTALSQGVAQIDLAKLASERTGNAAVLEIAREIATGQRRAARQLLALSPQVEVTADATGGRSLPGLSGLRFDRAYLDLAIQDQQRTLELCAKQARSPGLRGIHAFAAAWTPELRRLLLHLHQVAADVAVLPLVESPVQRAAAGSPPPKAGPAQR